MRSILHSLAWKEWHEHKWKFASIVTALWATVAIALLYAEHDGLGLGVAMMSYCIVPLAMFVGLGAAANERSRGTLEFMQALPADRSSFASAKLAAGLLTLVASVALTLPLFFGWAHWSSRSWAVDASRASVTGNIYLDITLLGTGLAASFFIWSAAAGVNRKDEVSAGALALVVILGWYAMLIIFAYLFFGWHPPEPGSPEESAIVFGLSTAPAGFLPASAPLWSRPNGYTDVVVHRYLILIVITAITTHGALITWYVRRFGRTANREVRSPQTAVRESSRSDWLSAPRQSAATAIAWKQFRESGPLVLAGLAGVVGITIGVFGTNSGWFLTRPGEFASIIWAVGVCIGFAVTLIVGIGVCYYDVSPQQNTFWRSRPINPDTWFWIKFGTGLMVLVTTLYIPLLLAVYAFHPDARDFLTVQSGASIFMAQIAVFAAAVAITCLVRHAVYAAILSIPVIYFGVIVMWLALRAAGAIGWIGDAPRKMMDMSQSQIALGFLFTFMVCAVVGWLAVRFDWGWKSRY